MAGMPVDFCQCYDINNLSFGRKETGIVIRVNASHEFGQSRAVLL
jgi:hypothetical protein